MKNVINRVLSARLNAHSLYRVILQINSSDFVKIILLGIDNYVLTLRKRLFCNATLALLPCKTVCFGTQNDRFCNVLTARLLYNRYSCKKY